MSPAILQLARRTIEELDLTGHDSSVSRRSEVAMLADCGARHAPCSRYVNCALTAEIKHNHGRVPYVPTTFPQHKRRPQPRIELMVVDYHLGARLGPKGEPLHRRAETRRRTRLTRSSLLASERLFDTH